MLKILELGFFVVFSGDETRLLLSLYKEQIDAFNYVRNYKI